MPAVLPNTTTADSYPAVGAGGAQVGVGDIFAQGFIVVANAAVFAQFYHGARGQQRASPDIFLPPGTYPLQGTPSDQLGGVVFKSASAGTPAQVFGALYYPGEAAVTAGSQFNATVAASGKIVNPGTGAMQVIQDQLLTVPAPSLDFQAIPNTFAHLWLLASVRADPVAASVNMAFRVNGDSGADYADQNAQASGAAVTAALNDPDTGGMFLGPVCAASAPNGSFTALDLKLLDYASTDNLKTAVSMVATRRTVGTQFPLQMNAGQQISALTAVNRLTLFPASGNFIAGSRATLYGLTSA